MAKREQRVRARFPRVGGFILAAASPKQSTVAWGSGAYGEELVGAVVDGLADEGVLALHDRRIPGRRANIDHLAFAPAGVFVIDAKRYNGCRVEMRRVRSWRAPTRYLLLVGGRDRSQLVTDLVAQVAVVRQALSRLPGGDAIPVLPVLAFVDGRLPLLGQLSLDGVQIVSVKQLATLLRQPGELLFEQRQAAQAHLWRELPSYTQG